jgi:tetratricopeptide (TPR) repeat protein
MPTRTCWSIALLALITLPAMAQRDGPPPVPVPDDEPVFRRTELFRQAVAYVHGYDEHGEQIWLGLGTYLEHEVLVVPWAPLERAHRVDVQPLCCERSEAEGIIGGGMESGVLLLSAPPGPLPDRFRIEPPPIAPDTDRLTSRSPVWTCSAPLGVGEEERPAGYLMVPVGQEPILEVRQYAGLGRMLRVRWKTRLIAPGSPIFDAGERLAGILVDYGGAGSFLAAPADRFTDLPRHEPIPPAQYAARDMGPTELAARKSAIAGRLVSMKDYQGALPYAADAVELDDRQWKARYDLGVCLDLTGRAAQAVAPLREATEIEPGFVEPWYSLGLLHLKAGRFEEALAPFREAIRIDGSYANAHGMLGASLFRLGRIDEAIEAAETAARVDPDNAQHHINLAGFYEATGRPADATRILEEYCGRNERDAHAWGRLGMLHFDREEYEQAIRPFEKALSRDPRNFDVGARLALSLAMTGQSEAALHTLDRLEEHHPSQPLLRQLRDAIIEQAKESGGP